MEENTQGDVWLENIVEASSFAEAIRFGAAGKIGEQVGGRTVLQILATTACGFVFKVRTKLGIRRPEMVETVITTDDSTFNIKLDGYSQTSWVYFDPQGNSITAEEYMAGITRHSKGSAYSIDGSH